MKIAFLCQDIVGQGVEYITAAMVRSFASRGYETELVVSKVHNDLVASGKKPFEVAPSTRWRHMPFRHSKLNIPYLWWYLWHTDADYLIIESGLYSFAVAVASFLIPRRFLPRLAQVVHGNENLLRGDVLKKTNRKHWFNYHKFTALMFVNQKSADNFKAMYPFLSNLRVSCVNNSCCDEVFQRKVKLPPSHPWLVKKDVFTLVTAGAYEPYKDHMTLVRAMKIVRDRGVRARVIIFGRGALEPTYRAYIDEHHLQDVVSVGGYTDRLPAEMKASDGFVLSSNWESFGIVVAEALACKVPCICTDAPFGPREILADGKYGRLVPIEDPEAMADAIIDCANGKIPVAPDESWQRYTIEAITNRYLKGLGIYNE